MTEFYCDRCPWTGESDRPIVFHSCTGSDHRLGSIRPARHRDEERQIWARTTFGAALEDAIDPEALLRPLDQEVT